MGANRYLKQLSLGFDSFAVVFSLQDISSSTGQFKMAYSSLLVKCNNQRLKRYLGVEPGAVTLLAIFNDPEHLVELVIDQSLWQSDAFQFHPLVNTATLVISRRNLKRFIAMIGHEPTIVDVPGIAEDIGQATDDG